MYLVKGMSILAGKMPRQNWQDLLLSTQISLPTIYAGFLYLPY